MIRNAGIISLEDISLYNIIDFSVCPLFNKPGTRAVYNVGCKIQSQGKNQTKSERSIFPTRDNAENTLEYITFLSCFKSELSLTKNLLDLPNHCSYSIHRSAENKHENREQDPAVPC
ncbi:hypothetical protein MTR_7g035460 [Medicago truncatula]|uniref:Uncharacterized protein n=1 Tax=Medicago truncatula TaxID=3880 RepID=A0A072TZH0_MEDTR|nr:hypothetical protein MTR_7g035460 [Medicago truncatula]